MVVGFDVRPLLSPHRVRGIGWYTKRLLVALKRLAGQKKDFEVVELKTQKDLSKKQYDLLHIPYFHPYFFTLPFVKRVPTVVTVHDLIPVKYPQHFPPGIKGRLRWEVQKRLLGRVDFVITDSFASKYDIADLAGYPQDRIYVVYLAPGDEFRIYEYTNIEYKGKNKKYQLPMTKDQITTSDQRANNGLGNLELGTQSSEFQNLTTLSRNKTSKLQVPSSLLAGRQTSSKLLKVRKKYRLPRRFVLYVGDVNWNKNVPGLVRACLALGVPLVIVGQQAASSDFDPTHPENKDLAWLKKMREKHSSLILTLGYVPTAELVAIYNLATVYCQPSFDEGFGLPVLEAMACGCPVVASNRGSLPEVVGDAGILVEPTVESLKREIRRLWQSEKLRQRLSKKGLKQAASFSWEQTAQKTFAVYQLSKAYFG